MLRDLWGRPVVRLALAGAALVLGFGGSCWHAAHQQSTAERRAAAAELRAHELDGQLTEARAAYAQLQARLAVALDSLTTARRAVRIVPGAGRVDTLRVAGDSVPYPVPVEVTRVIRACDSVAPRCAETVHQADHVFGLGDSATAARDAALERQKEATRAAARASSRKGFGFGVLAGAAAVIGTVILVK